LIDILEIFDGVFEIFDTFAGDICRVSLTYMMGFLEIFFRFPGYIS